MIGSNIADFTALGDGRFVFSATDGINGNELWVTDGTSAGTTIVKDINPGTNDLNMGSIFAIGGGKAVFRAN